MLYELRIYHCLPGRLPEVSRRFETVALKFWKKHGIRPLGFWTVQVGPSNQDIYYMLQWQDLAERERVWNAFTSDPDWISARAETEKNGQLVASIENMLLAPTHYSELK